MLQIRRVNALRDAGPWLCEVEDYRGDTVEKYVFLRVNGGGSNSGGGLIGSPTPFRVDPTLRRAMVEKGYSKTLTCPVIAVAGSLTVCNWEDPVGREFAFLGRFVENNSTQWGHDWVRLLYIQRLI